VRTLSRNSGEYNSSNPWSCRSILSPRSDASGSYDECAGNDKVRETKMGRPGGSPKYEKGGAACLSVLRIGSWVFSGAGGRYVTGVFVSAALLIGAAVLILLIAMRS
jgi:hypothetical protein